MLAADGRGAQVLGQVFVGLCRRPGRQLVDDIGGQGLGREDVSYQPAAGAQVRDVGFGPEQLVPDDGRILGPRRSEVTVPRVSG